jgi:hypothetical protein
MKASELFGVFVRAAGFLIFLFGLWELWGGLENLVENALTTDTGDQTSSFTFFADGVPSLVVGIILFFIADWVVHLAYRKPEA